MTFCSAMDGGDIKRYCDTINHVTCLRPALQSRIPIKEITKATVTDACKWDCHHSVLAG